MGKIINELMPIIKAIILTVIIIALFFMIVGFIAYVINVVCINPTTAFQRISFVVFILAMIGISWFCMSGKE